MVVNYLFLLLCLFSLYLKNEYLIPTLYLTYTFVFETAITAKLTKRPQCYYLTIKIFSGLFSKLILLTHAAFSSFLYQNKAPVHAIMLTIFLIASQYAPIKMLFLVFKRQEENIL